jgi:methylated-DNA-protein-cysteine methyltransferase-like protein
MSYGGVAVCAGSRAPRAVGGVLAQYGDEVPWHRVVRADGSLAEHVRIRQRRLLAEEGVPMDGDRVIMEWAEYSGGRRGPRPDRALG